MEMSTVCVREGGGRRGSESSGVPTAPDTHESPLPRRLTICGVSPGGTTAPSSAPAAGLPSPRGTSGSGSGPGRLACPHRNPCPARAPRTPTRPWCAPRRRPSAAASSPSAPTAPSATRPSSAWRKSWTGRSWDWAPLVQAGQREDGGAQGASSSTRPGATGARPLPAAPGRSPALSGGMRRIVTVYRAAPRHVEPLPAAA